jgi:hypothetical protein
MNKTAYLSIAFFLLAIAVASLTTNTFLKSSVNNFDTVKKSFTKSDILLNESLKQFYADMSSEDRQQFADIEKMTPAQRKLLLQPQCVGDLLTSPFCNPRFIAGQITLDQALREQASEQISAQQSEALDDLKAKLDGYLKYPLLLIGILGMILSLLIYFSVGRLFGLQAFFGNLSWLSVLSAVSFKIMPATIDNLVSVTSQASGNIPPAGASLLKQVVSSWLVPAMNKAFVLSIILTIVGSVVWISIKLLRKYAISIERQ